MRSTFSRPGPNRAGWPRISIWPATSIERFYHFICKAEPPRSACWTNSASATVRWRGTSMAYFIDGKLHWGDPFALLRFPGISLLSRLRYGLLAFVSTKRERWDALESQYVREWITRWGGQEVWDRLWKPLLDLKFHEYADQVSAAVDLDPGQADRPVAQVDVPGRARLYRGRQPDPGRRALPRDRGRRRADRLSTPAHEVGRRAGA